LGIYFIALFVAGVGVVGDIWFGHIEIPLWAATWNFKSSRFWIHARLHHDFNTGLYCPYPWCNRQISCFLSSSSRHSNLRVHSLAENSSISKNQIIKKININNLRANLLIPGGF